MEKFILQFRIGFLNTSPFTHFAFFPPWFIFSFVSGLNFTIRVLITSIIHENNENGVRL